MDSDFSAKLQSVLSNPEAMAKISAIASSMGNGTPKEEVVSAEPEAPKAISALSQMPLSSADPKLTLLSSLKPLIREEKRNKVDSLINALTVASMLKNLRK